MLEDLLFTEAAFELDGDHQLRQFPAIGLLRSKKEAARELLGQRGGAPGSFAGDDSVVGGLGGSYDVEPGMIEETMILDRQDRVTHDLGDLVVLDESPLRAVFVEKIGNQLGLELVDVPRLVVAHRDDLGDFVAF